MMKRRTFTKTRRSARRRRDGRRPAGDGAAGEVRVQGADRGRREGRRLTYYTANFAEVEQEVIKEFNKTFPKIKV